MSPGEKVGDRESLLKGKKAASDRVWDVDFQARPASHGTLVALAGTSHMAPPV